MYRFSLLLVACVWSALADGSAASAAATAPDNNRRFLQEALLPQTAPEPQLQANSSSSTCWGWKKPPPCFTNATAKPIFALLGDSITDFGFKSYGWASMLRSEYGGAVSLVNYGIPGATTRKVDEVFTKLQQQLGPHLSQVKLATICFGANDAVKANSPNWHLPVSTYVANLRRLVANLTEQGITKIVLITPPAVGKRNDRDSALTVDYAKAVLELAKELQLDGVDTFNPIQAVPDWQDEALETDQLHLSGLGQGVFFNSVWQVLANSTDLSPAALAAQQPQQPAAVVAAAAPAVPQQQEGQQQQQAAISMDSQDAEAGSKAISNVLCILMAVLFLAVITESKQAAHSRAGLAEHKKSAP